MVPISIKCDLAKGVCVISGRTIKMPSDAVTLITTGLGVSVLAGILSGVCYVLAHGIGTRRRSRKKHSEWFCEICGAYLYSTKNILNEDLVKCTQCGARVCTTKCSKLVQHTRWVCSNCLKPPDSWLMGILNAIQPNIQGFITSTRKMNCKASSNPDLDSLRKLEKEQIRDFIEKLVNVMLGENVDNASVSMLYNDNHYQLLFDRYHQELSSSLTDLGSALHISMTNLPVAGQSPCTAHQALKQLIEKLLKEAVNLPLLQKAHAEPVTPSEDITNRSYEDLLATAIINKVVTSTPTNNLPSSSANSVSSRVSNSSKNREEKEYFFGEETLDTKWKTADLDTTSVSSLEEWLQSESSIGSKKYVDKVTLMIKQDIEEVNDFYSENEDDDSEYFRSSSSLMNDSESNWFLQRRQFHGTHSPVPVPMLVPNPSTDAKVLIGDKPLDDTSDLSDAGSDEEGSIQPQSTHSLLIQAKNIIGGGKQNFESVENVDVHSESSTDSGVKEVNGNEQKTFDIPEISKTDISLDDDNIEDSSFISTYSNTEKEAEYTEKYASLPKQILKTPTPKKRYKNVTADTVSVKSEENYDVNKNAIDLEFVGGNYSKKEKEKWRHAVEMKNNPYSKANIERRIQRSNSTTSSIFGPDYYARLAGKPSGARQQSAEINGVSWPPPEPSRSRSLSPPPELPKVSSPPEELTEIESTILPELPKCPPPRIVGDTPPEPPKTQPPSKELILLESEGIHQAIKAVVTPSEENMIFHSIETYEVETSKEETNSKEDQVVQTNTAEVTSDSDLSLINFYDVEHSQVIKKSKNENVHIPIKPLPVGLSYKPLSDEDVVNKKEANVPEKDKEVPVAKPRVLGIQNKYENGLYIKAESATKHRNITPIERPVFRRYQSESSLIDSHDATQKNRHQKKDNTLISKIYKDPKVRLFALNSREEIPGSEGDYIPPVLRTQRSVDSKLSESSSVYLSRGNNSSDNGLTLEYESGKTGKMSFFGSEEDMLSINSEASFRHVSTMNGEGESNKSATTSRTPSTKNFIYSSQDDLLSIDDGSSSLPKRKDNTLISKIYKDANVRNFAIKNSKHIAVEQDVRKKLRNISTSSDQENYHNNNKLNTQKSTAKKQMFSSYDDLSSAEISLETSHTYSPDVTLSSELEGIEKGFKSEDIEVDEVEKRHVVRQALGKFSKSEANIKSAFHRSTSVEDGDRIRVSVRDLRKLFENNNVSNKPVISSLTARSLSKQIKESLRQ